MPDFPAAVPLLPQLPYYTQDDFLALFDRILPDHYLVPLKNPGPGYEYLQAVAAQLARVSQAISHTMSGGYIGSGTGGSYATVTVKLTRPTTTFQQVTLLGRQSATQGTLVGTEDGFNYQLLTDVTFGADELGPKYATAQAVVRGWVYNLPGPFTTEDGELVAGPINRLVRPVFPLTPVPPNFDPTIVVEQVDDATGGSAPMLDASGDDRGLPRILSGITSASLSFDGSSDITVLPGSVFSTVEGFHYQTTQPVSFAIGELGPKPVAVAPLFLNERANENPLSLVLSIVTPDEAGDTTKFTVASDAPQIEPDTEYRARISLLPKTVTPSALQTALTNLLGNTLSAQSPPVSYAYREVWDLRYQTVYDMPTNLTLSRAALNVPAVFNGNVFVYDYAPADPLSNRYLDQNPARGVVVIKLPLLADPNLIGRLYPQAVALLEQIKPAGIEIQYILTT